MQALFVCLLFFDKLMINDLFIICYSDNSVNTQGGEILLPLLVNAFDKKNIFVFLFYFL